MSVQIWLGDTDPDTDPTLKANPDPEQVLNSYNSTLTIFFCYKGQYVSKLFSSFNFGKNKLKDSSILA